MFKGIFKKILTILLNVNSNKLYIDKSDLPSEFGDRAVNTINDFINNTFDLDYEMGMFFDYKTGEIIKKARGSGDNVKIEYSIGDFEGKHIASIHNHHIGLLSSPSGKNFGILERDFEDYELIASSNELWIFKAIGTFKGLTLELRTYSDILFKSLQVHCSLYYSLKDASNKIDEQYGKQLSEYINNKKEKNLKLTKVRYKL